MKLILIQPRGFCAGVKSAIEIVEEALKKWGPPIYVHHEIVHNYHVINALKEKGVIFVDDIKLVPTKSKLIYSAHGVSPEVRKEAARLALHEIDATCILVDRLHNAIKKHVNDGYKIILLGHKNHAEVIGLLGEAPYHITLIQQIEDVGKLNHFTIKDKLFFVAQTTLNVDDVDAIKRALLKKFPKIKFLSGSSTCYATMHRQLALKRLAKLVDLILVIGDSKSSNSNRLLEVGLKQGVKAHLINDEKEIKDEWLVDINTIGMSAGASTPEAIVQRCVDYLRSSGATVEEKSFNLKMHTLLDPNSHF